MSAIAPDSETAQRLAAIVEFSDDAIISKDLNGIITSWNNGAQRIFGYSTVETIGKSVTMLMPADRVNEEPGILRRIRSGERIDHYETVRRHKNGTLLDISLTVSPVRNAEGVIIGASKIARDITERKRSEKHRELLMAELTHRVKNTLATVLSIERLSFAGQAETAAQLAFRARIEALAHAHQRIAEGSWLSVSLQSLIEGELLPYARSDRSNVVVSGPPVNLSARCALSLGLGVHELTTNAAKYGALSSPQGRVTVTWRENGDDIELDWRELGGPVVSPPSRSGFGRMLLEEALHHELNSTVTMDFRPEGLRCTILIPRQSCEIQSY